MAKVNYDAFRSFDINECCDHFDSEKQTNWKKIGKFIVADGQEFQEEADALREAEEVNRMVNTLEKAGFKIVKA